MNPPPAAVISEPQPVEVPVAKKRRRRSLFALLEMRIVQVDRRIDQMDKQIADTRQEMRDLRQEMREEFVAVRQEMREQFIAVRQEMRDFFALAERRTDDLRQEMRGEFIAVRQEMSWHTNFLGVMIVSMSVIITVAIGVLGWVMTH